ncbi:MAG: hypothetical protein CMH57_01340, partial [Myxococcales bacterium]|nr:hypothetical protein [Myxococcales bacterium]
MALTLTLAGCSGDDSGGGDNGGETSSVEDTGGGGDNDAGAEDTDEAADTGGGGTTSPEDTGEPPEDTGAPPEDTGEPPEDTGESPEDTEPPEDTGAPEDVEEDTPVVDSPFPRSLDVRWTNLEADNRVTFGKKIVVEIEPLAEQYDFPTTWREEQLWSKQFPAHMYTLNRDGERVEVPFLQKWKTHEGEKRFRPAIIIEPLPQGWPTASQMEFTLDLGNDEEMVVPFRTLPVQYDQFLEVQVTVPARDCPTCFPYDVDMFVFLPPGYVDSNNPAYNNAA